MHRWILPLLLLSLALSAGCGGDSDSPLSVGPAQNGQSVVLDAGQRLVVELPGNPTTGFEWSVVRADPTLFRLEDSSFSADSSAIGAGGTFSFRFELLRPGADDLRLEYRRSWENAPVDSFSLSVTAR